MSRSSDPAVRGITLASLDEPKGRRLLADVSGVVYAPPQAGHQRGVLVIRRGRGLVAQPFDQERLTLGGDPVAIADQVATSPDTVPPVASASSNGLLIWASFVTEADGDSRMAWLDASGKRAGTPLLSGVSTVSLSSDGRFAMASLVDVTAGDSLVLVDLARNSTTRFPRGDAPVWSPDSTTVIVGRSGDFYRRDLASGQESLVLPNSGAKNPRNPADWSRDGATCSRRKSRPRPGGISGT